LNRIVEDHHHAVTSVPFERAVVHNDDFADGGVVVPQQGHHVFRIRAFNEPVNFRAGAGWPLGSGFENYIKRRLGRTAHGREPAFIDHNLP
jgi:hypothetical protein